MTEDSAFGASVTYEVCTTGAPHQSLSPNQWMGGHTTSDGGFETVAGEASEPSEPSDDATQNEPSQESLLLQDAPEELSEATGCGCDQSAKQVGGEPMVHVVTVGPSATLIEQTRWLYWQGESDHSRVGQKVSVATSPQTRAYESLVARPMVDTGFKRPLSLP